MKTPDNRSLPIETRLRLLPPLMAVAALGSLGSIAWNFCNLDLSPSGRIQAVTCQYIIKLGGLWGIHISAAGPSSRLVGYEHVVAYLGTDAVSLTSHLLQRFPQTSAPNP